MEEPDKVWVYYSVSFVEYDRVYGRDYNSLEEADAAAVAFRLNELCDARIYKITRERIS